VWEQAVADLYLAAAVALAGVVVVVLTLTVGAAVVVIVGCPVKGYMVVKVRMSYSGQWR